MYKADFVSKLLNERYSSKIQSVSAGISDVIFHPVFIGMAILIIGIGFAFWKSYQEIKNCQKWERKVVHQSAWTQFILVGKVMVPVYHSAGDYYIKVCTEIKK